MSNVGPGLAWASQHWWYGPGSRLGVIVTEHVRAGFGPGSSEIDQTTYKTYRDFLGYSSLFKENCIQSCSLCVFMTQSENKQLVLRTVTPFVRFELTRKLQRDCTRVYCSELRTELKMSLGNWVWFGSRNKLSLEFFGNFRSCSLLVILHKPKYKAAPSFVLGYL